MKHYEVEIKRTSFVTMRIDAENPEAAESLAYEELNDEHYLGNHASYDIESIEEVYIKQEGSK